MKESKLKYDNIFWKNTYYHKNKITLENSTFSEFISERLNPGQKILDICSGNGRDSLFFKKMGLIVHSFDINSPDGAKEMGIHHKKLDLLKKSKFFSYVPNFFDHVYCRFVLHSIPENLEDYILANSNWCLKKEGLLYIEVRSDKGYVSKSSDQHYRRLVNLKTLKDKLKNLNFDIVTEKEDSGLSKYKKDDPVLIRIIARKKADPTITNPYKFMEIRDEAKYINKNDASKILLTFKKIMNINQLDFYLVFGTLLGAYREGDFITHDKDIDVCILEEDRNEITDLITSGILSIYGIKLIRFGNNLISISYNETYLDIYLFDEKMDFYRCDSYRIDKRHIEGEPNYIKFLDDDFLTLNEIEFYLNEHYGENWNIPIEDLHAEF
jgi:phosphorylcholine metabolism protein LicD